MGGIAATHAQLTCWKPTATLCELQEFAASDDGGGNRSWGCSFSLITDIEERHPVLLPIFAAFVSGVLFTVKLIQVEANNLLA